MRLFTSIQLATVLGILLVGATGVSAHVTGASWEAVDGSNTIDIGYDPIAVVAGTYENFDFKLRNTASGNSVDFAQVWVRVTKEKSTVLATGLFYQPIGPTTLLYEFGSSGDYVLQASFRDADGNDIAVGSFPITVQKGGGIDTQGVLISVAIFLFGGCLGALGFSIGRRKCI